MTDQTLEGRICGYQRQVKKKKKELTSSKLVVGLLLKPEEVRSRIIQWLVCLYQRLEQSADKDDI